MRYAEQQVTHPSRTVVVLVSDFEEGGSVAQLLASVRRLAESGVRLLGLAALDEAAEPVYDQGTARRLAECGMHVAALTRNASPSGSGGPRMTPAGWAVYAGYDDAALAALANAACCAVPAKISRRARCRSRRSPHTRSRSPAGLRSCGSVRRVRSRRRAPARRRECASTSWPHACGHAITPRAARAPCRALRPPPRAPHPATCPSPSPPTPGRAPRSRPRRGVPSRRQAAVRRVVERLPAGLLPALAGDGTRSEEACHLTVDGARLTIAWSVGTGSTATPAR
ncbi:VWA domain-containing protein [Oerskovia sp. M15]